MRKKVCLLLVHFISVVATAQTTDSVKTGSQLEEVQVQGYLSREPLLSTPASVAVLNESQLENQASESLVPAMNTIPGVRMEERSPGSYRLSLRGSLLRSPFGIRNVKVYLEEFPLTDAGGNTYLNLIDTRGISSLEILKGPDGSLFGANSGGVLIVNTTPNLARKRISAEVSAGSFGLLHQSLRYRLATAKTRLTVNQGYQRSDGYRENSAMRRHYFQAAYEWNYRRQNQLKFYGFYSDLAYQTPGGLTLAQFQENPKQARPAAGPNPGAATQKAGIYNKTLFGGISHEIPLSARVKHVAAIFGSGTAYRNPFITNYETRSEANLGLRTYLQVSSVDSAVITWLWTTGLEGQHASQRIRNFDNLGGSKGDLQSADKLNAFQHFYFTRISWRFFERLSTEAGLSLNYFHYRYQNLPESADQFKGNRYFQPEWMPRLALSYLATPQLALRASASRGYSSPTIAEIRPSGQQINNQLQAETGWNYETGARYSHSRNRFQVDASVFKYALEQAIVRRLNEGGEEFFTNAGGTRQTGWETLLSGWFIEAKPNGLLTGLQGNGSFTLNHFRFANYQNADNYYSGNWLTGVPRHVVSTGLVLHLLSEFSVSGQFTYTGRLPLNDANTVYAESYRLLQVKLRWQKETKKLNTWELYAGADNLLNEQYSLGHDINAFGNRYYNAAPGRNFYAGISFAH